MIVNKLNPCRTCGSEDAASHQLEQGKMWRTGCSICFEHTNLFKTAAESREEWNLYNKPKNTELGLCQRKLDECHTFIASLLNSTQVTVPIRDAAYDLLAKHRLGE